MSNQSIFIRIAEPKDIGALSDLAAKTFRQTYAVFNTPENLEGHIDEHFNHTALSLQLANSSIRFYLVFFNDLLAGYLKINTGDAQTEDMPPNDVEIERIYLLEEHQRKGIGGAMIQFAIQEATVWGKERLWLGVWEKNEAAIDFYKKMGFTVFGTHSFMMGDDEQNDYMMGMDIA